LLLQPDALAVLRQPANLKIGFEYPKPQPYDLVVGLLHRRPDSYGPPIPANQQGITRTKHLILLTFSGDRRFSEKVVAVH
jgi:hypothetical protein